MSVSTKICVLEVGPQGGHVNMWWDFGKVEPSRRSLVVSPFDEIKAVPLQYVLPPAVYPISGFLYCNVISSLSFRCSGHHPVYHEVTQPKEASHS